MSSPADTAALGRWLGAAAPVPAADVRIVTSGGRSIPAHSIVLASASAVLERKLDRLERRGGAGDNCKALLVLGVPCDAVEVFVRMIYTAAGDEAAAEGEGVGRYGFHLLALAHVYRVGWMKRACEAALAARLTAEAVVDVLQLARMCDAPKLAVRCLRFVAREFAAVQQTEGWGWVRANDPRLELEILRFVEDTDMRKKHRRKRREEQETYLQLGEAMDCLRHICCEGCTIVGPSDGKPPNKSMPPCDNFGTCWKMQLLICHFATCARKRSCHRCKRVSQLFRLHSAICDPLEPCKVPLCRRPFKLRSKEMDSKAVDDERWRLLAKKVSSIRVMHLLAKRRRHT